MCEEVCKQQKEFGDPTNPTKSACQEEPNSCLNLNSEGGEIGQVGYTENVYSFCIDSLKQCMLGQYVCDRDEMVFEFWNAWMTGLLYFVQIRYKESVNSDGYLKKAKFCDADWDESFLGGHKFTYPFKNQKHNTMITERELFQIDGYGKKYPDAGLIKYWPRQTIPPLGWGTTGNDKKDYIRGSFDDIYYNARQMKRPYGYNDTPTPVDQTSGNILLATEIVSLGSYLIFDDPDNAPFFISQIPETTYKRPDDLSNYFCFSCNKIIPNNGTSGIRLHEKICEFGSDFNDEEELVNDIYYGNHTYGLYIDESYHSGRTHILTSNSVEDLNNNTIGLSYGDTPLMSNPSLSYIYIGDEITNSSIQSEADAIYVNQQNGIWETRVTNYNDLCVKYTANPFYMYFGLHPGKTAIDIVHNEFIPKNICGK
jgi:hypothetical protein